MIKLFDPKCYELAEYFLQDNPARNTHENRNVLAQYIQDATEEFFTSEFED